MIYFTPYSRIADEWIVTASSSDSGFATFDEVIGVLGKPVYRSHRYVIYGDDQQRTLYTDYAFSI